MGHTLTVKGLARGELVADSGPVYDAVLKTGTVLELVAVGDCSVPYRVIDLDIV